MIEIKTSDSRYKLLTDLYPFTESRDLVSKMSHWWDSPSRKKYISKKDNYSLDENIPNSLENSFKTKLKNGIFSFLFFNDECIAYGGLQVQSNHSWMHRFLSSPYAGKSIYNSVSSFMIPYQISVALELNCTNYSLTFNEDNAKVYNWFSKKNILRAKTSLNTEKALLISKFDSMDKKIINHCEQIVYTLNLKRDDINEFCRF